MANQEMFQEIHGLLVEFPELHHQNFWEGTPEKTGSCGTTRCVAGWAVWVEAKRLGLLSRKRESTGNTVLLAIARHHDIPYTDTDSLYEEIGAYLLGLTADDATNLFWDMNDERVTDRVKSYAQTGEDISDEEYDRY